MKKYKLGYTSGVFDLFHIGHLNILKKAKEHCDHLIVAVSTDELVQSYKNKTPVIPHVERMEIVKSITFVDEVVAQTKRDKVAAMEKHQFDVMFVGSDWKGNALFNETERIFNENGVDVVYFPYTSNTSSTLLTQVLTKIAQPN
ncbi:adenylyltransferase/cytidyltransferase family protein [Listeria booriae]|uniref:adenylyltransferase/cytidyltransferase family protein n=1 Tax=Listeria booriae TaxID=1552123 RepID=UPI0016288456|nr:adenylyltransferase/cytidyltransferase family protein [Listeria booriae]MBC1800027.1 adenylyltransferase/cytidyltransferase family protein [Listeria booriae]